jgi:hypothetical protein
MSDNGNEKISEMNRKMIGRWWFVQKKDLPYDAGPSKMSIDLNSAKSHENIMVMDDTESLKTIANEVLDGNRDVCRNSYYDQFFKQDSSTRELDAGFINSLKLDQIKDHEEKFIWDQFFEFLGYILIFYFLLGPFSILFAWKWPGIKLWKNLNFWSHNLKFYLDCLVFFCNVTNYILYFTYEVKRIGDSYVYSIEILSLFVFVLIKSINMASKYGTMHPLKLLYYRHHIVTQKEKDFEDCFGDWIKQTDEIIHEEFHNSLLRQGVDLSMFYFSFLIEPKEETAEHLNTTLLTLSRYHKKSWVPYAPEPLMPFKNECPFYGLSIFYEIAKNVPQTSCRSYLICFFTLSVLRGLFPFIARGLESRNIFGDTPTDMVQLIFLFIANSYSYYMVLVSLLVFKQDLKRKEYFMMQCSNLLSPRKELEYRVKKLLPTINIVCITNLKAWWILRKLCLDYGKKYNSRAQMATSLICLASLVEILIVSIGVTKFIQFLPITIAICMYDVLNMLGSLQAIFFSGAVINDHYRIHKNILKENQAMVNDLLIFRKLYIKPGFEHTNFLYKTASEKLNCMSTQCITGGFDVADRLAIIKKITETIITDLDFEELNDPFKVLELEITKHRINQILLGLASLSTMLLKSFIEERMKGTAKK